VRVPAERGAAMAHEIGAAAIGASATVPSRWFSSNPDKAWVEKFFLLYSPLWMASMAVMMLTGWDKQWSDTALLVQGFAVALPVLLVPMLLAARFTTTKWHESYWLKANLYLFLFGFFGNYFGSEYFFDVLGMVYNYPQVTTTFDSALVGSGRQTVPLIMYCYTHVYFMTYHATANIALRRMRQLPLPAMWLLFPLFVFLIGYFWAWMETTAMANPLMASSFYYRKMELMLKYGSAIYATYFVASFPIYYFIGETAHKPWSLLQTAAGALSASMLTFYLLDFAARWVGHL
jgi:cycloeucalenol cycloisomerase